MFRFSLTALTALAATAAVAAPAQAAPDWLPATDVGDANGSSTSPVVGYADGGVEIEAHLKINSGKVPFDVDLVAAKRQAGSAPATELTIPTTSAGVPADLALDVAPSGAAVLVWKEIDPKTAEGVQRFRAAYRDKSGTWEQPVLLGTDALRDDAIFPQL